MTANQLSKKFLIWWQEQNPDGKIYRNNAGSAKRSKTYVKFGIPPKGGADWIAFIPKQIIKFQDEFSRITSSFLTVQFYEIKTKNDKISPEQKQFFDMITNMGGEVFIVREIPISIKEHASFYNKHFINCTDEFFLEKWSIK
jgi:hypothetical protein